MYLPKWVCGYGPYLCFRFSPCPGAVPLPKAALRKSLASRLNVVSCWCILHTQNRWSAPGSQGHKNDFGEGKNQFKSQTLRFKWNIFQLIQLLGHPVVGPVTTATTADLHLRSGVFVQVGETLHQGATPRPVFRNFRNWKDVVVLGLSLAP